ncbi:type VI secretion system lipoprotein TssJ [Xenorhabdus szentirmaii]|uniref:type VI secretion system lipoprotein TssJ n=1 Tax=Xenorhabdus szentirmaii TaxID=290112 RepID=UPI0032B849DA
MARRFRSPAGKLGGVCLLASLLAGCGLTQTVSEGTVAVTKAIFFKQIKVLRLDFTPRAALNTDGDQAPLTTMVRVYQLKDRKAFDGADYQQLLRQDEVILKNDLLAQQAVLVMPDGSVSLDMPMENDTQFVAVVGLFRVPDHQKGDWRIVLRSSDLDPDKPRTLELGDGALTLLPLRD